MRSTISLRHFSRTILLLALVLGTSQIMHSQQPSKAYKRIKPSAASQNTGNIFFGDVFGEALVGERPANLGVGGGTSAVVTLPSTGGNTPPAGSSDPAPAGAAGEGWAKYISAQTVQDEIKKVKLEIDQDVTTPSVFNGNGHKGCRRNFSLLAMLFAITADYGGDIRWKTDAPKARDLFARAGRNCKTATTASFNEAKARKADLEDLIGGGNLAAGEGGAASEDWSQGAERSQLMGRIEKANNNLRRLAASPAEFTSGAEEVLHEAEMLAAMSEALMQPGMPDGDDDDYAAHSKVMRDSALEIINAAKTNTPDAAAKALGNITNSCDACHESYRG